MRRRCILGLVLLAGTAACRDDVLLAPATPTAAPHFSIAGGTTDLSSGYDFVCALRSGVVVCYGDRDDGQPIGVHRATVGGIVQIDAGFTHACGVRTDGAVECWGSNEYGQAPALRRATTGSYTFVSGGSGHSCAVRTDGAVECWGFNEYGQAPPLTLPGNGKFTQVTANASNSCALRSDGIIQCWGRREGAPAVRTDPTGGYYVSLAEGIGGPTNCALTSNGVADCWGYRAGWRVGPYTQLGLSGNHLCALRTNRTADCWGYPLNWQGPGERSLTGPKEGTVGDQTWTQISVGAYHSCGLRPDGHFECFGEAQSIGSDAPDVRPNRTVPKTSVWGRKLRVQWVDVNSNEQRTEIQRSVADRNRVATTWTPVTLMGTDRYLFFDSVPDGAVYVHRIRVCNNAGCSEWGESNATAMPAGVPAAPGSLTATPFACAYMSCARLNWTSDNTFVESFHLQRRSYADGVWGAWENLLDQDRLVTTYNNYNLTPGIRYQYRIQACNVRGCSSHTWSQSFVAISPPPPSAPADLTTSAMGNYMYLAWGDVATEERWEIQRREQTNGVWGAWVDRQGAWMNDTHQQDPITPSTLYQYRIRACNQGGCSAYTSAVPTQT